MRARGHLRLAAPKQYGGRGVPYLGYLELLELFAMSHASLRMIVHVSNGTWRTTTGPGGRSTCSRPPSSAHASSCPRSPGTSGSPSPSPSPQSPAPPCAAAPSGRATRTT
ncbi:MAG: hypothetical protein ACYCSX_06315 [Acidimicrobiales bacterium]